MGRTATQEGEALCLALMVAVLVIGRVDSEPISVVALGDSTIAAPVVEEVNGGGD